MTPAVPRNHTGARKEEQRLSGGAEGGGLSGKISSLLLVLVGLMCIMMWISVGEAPQSGSSVARGASGVVTSPVTVSTPSTLAQVSTASPHTTEDEPSAGAEQLLLLGRGEIMTSTRTCRDIVASGAPDCEWHTDSRREGGATRLGVRSVFPPALHPQPSLLLSKIVVRASGRVGSDGGSGGELQPVVNPKKCMDGALSASDKRPRSLVVIGHSHSRYMAGMLCMMLNASSACELFAEQARVITIVNRSSSPGAVLQPPHIAFLQANYDLVPKLDALVSAMAGWESGSPPSTLDGATKVSTIKFVTHVLLSRGVWDLAFMDSSNDSHVVAQLMAGIEKLHQVFPRAKIIMHMPHFVYSRVHLAKKSHKRLLAWRYSCLAPHRMRRMRDVNLCAAARAVERDSQLDVALFDSWNLTQTAMAEHFVDGLGHHFLDAFLEMLVAKFLGEHVCPDAAAPQFRSDLRTDDNIGGDAACAAVQCGAFDVSPQCMCHNSTVAEREWACKVFSKVIPQLSSRN